MVLSYQCSLLSLSDGPDRTELTPANRTYFIDEYHPGLDVLCSCGDCVPSCSSEWFFNGKSFGNNRSLQLNNISRNDAGIYVCICTNQKTQKTENEQFDLTVLCKSNNFQDK